jgi:hypothetical protein
MVSKYHTKLYVRRPGFVVVVLSWSSNVWSLLFGGNEAGEGRENQERGKSPFQSVSRGERDMKKRKDIHAGAYSSPL